MVVWLREQGPRRSRQWYRVAADRYWGVLERSSGLMRKYADQGVSYADCLSFALMKREKLRWAAGLDGHF
jgi:predicted nucleic acid-binding protein